MPVTIHRREILQALGAAALVSSARVGWTQARPGSFRMPAEGRGTPKIYLGVPGNMDEAGMRAVATGSRTG